MDVIVPQYIKAPAFFDTNLTNAGLSKKYAKLISVSFNDVAQLITPTTDIWSASTTYAADAEVNYMPLLGTRDEGIWKKYKSLAGSNINHTPPEYGADEYWLDLGAIESYKAFDYYVNTKTSTSKSESVAQSLKIKFETQSVTTSLALINVNARFYQLKVWDSSDNLIFDGTAPEHEPEAIYQKTTSYVDYFFSDFEYIRNIAIPQYTTFTMYPRLKIEIMLSGLINEYVYVGQVIAGRAYNIGATQYGVSTGIKDYSKKITDETFGESYLKQGNYKDTINCDLLIMNENKNEVNSVLRQLRAKPTVWQGNQYDSEYDDFLVFGFMNNFTIVHDNYTSCEASLEIEGLI